VRRHICHSISFPVPLSGIYVKHSHANPGFRVSTGIRNSRAEFTGIRNICGASPKFRIPVKRVLEFRISGNPEFPCNTLIESCKAMRTSSQHGRLYVCVCVCVYACFVDFRKAFDTIPRDKLWEHLSNIGVQGKMLEALKSYYANVRVCVDIPSLGRSAPFDSTMGVKQGCPMSPTLRLFGLYIDQLETHLQYHAQDALELQGQKVSILLYADDIVLMSRSPAGLQHLLHVLQLFCGAFSQYV